MFGILFDACIFVPPDGNGNSAGIRKMGNIHIMTEKITIAEVAETYGRKADTLWRKAKRTWPERTWSVHSVLTEEEGRILLGDWPAPKSVKRKKPLVPNKPNGAKFAAGLKAFHAAYPPEENDLTEIRTPAHITVNQPLPPTPGDDTPPARQGWTWRDALLIGLMIAPTAASVENMYSVTFSLSTSAHSAIFLTAVLSVSAIGFVVAGVRNWYTVGLAALLIAYESFCNLTRIYGGLMGIGTHTGNPTRFVGLVTDIFGTGTHWTAIFLGGFTAFFIAAVQYAAVFELNKSK